MANGATRFGLENPRQARHTAITQHGSKSPQGRSRCRKGGGGGVRIGWWDRILPKVGLPTSLRRRGGPLIFFGVFWGAETRAVQCDSPIGFLFLPGGARIRRLGIGFSHNWGPSAKLSVFAVLAVDPSQKFRGGCRGHEGSRLSLH